MRRCDGRWGDAMDDEAMLWGDAMDDEAMLWTMRRCDGRCGDAMDDEAMRWTMRRCDGRWGDAIDDEAMRWSDGNIAPSHRLIVHRIASSSIASPHRPSHRLIVHRIASSSIASPHRLPLRNASWTIGCFRAHAWRTGTLRLVLLRKFRTKWKVGILIMFQFTCCMVPMYRCSFDGTHLSTIRGHCGLHWRWATTEICKKKKKENW